jgi:hypothetical protein
MKQKAMNTYIIHFSNLHFCGGQHEVLVDATCEQDAIYNAEGFMWDYQNGLFGHEDYEEEGIDVETDGCYTVDSVELFDENHEFWKFRDSFDRA